MSEFNSQKMSYIADKIIEILKYCLANKHVWQTDKDQMLKQISLYDAEFYDKYSRVCRTIVFEEDISPLIGMISTFAKVQNGKLSLTKANDMISGALNSKYVDPILNSEKLVKERDEKKKIEVIL